MKKIYLFLALCTLLTGFVTVNSRAQENPTFFIVFEEFVSPVNLNAYSEVTEKVHNLWGKVNMDIPVYCYNNDEDAFYWVIPLFNLSLEGLYDKMTGVHKQMVEEQNFDPEKAYNGLYTGRQSIIRWLNDLSYHRDGKFGQSPDKIYIEWTFCSLISGHEEEAGEAVKKFVDFFSKTDETYEWDVYEVSLGYDTPMWIIMDSAESPLAMRQLEMKLYEKYQDDLKDMWQEFAKHLRKTKNVSGWFRQGWSVNTAQQN